MPRHPFILAVAFCGAALTAQDNVAETDRELQSVIREQENALRRLKSLRTRMERLKARMAEEGRDQAAALLQRGLDELAASKLEDRMSDVAGKLKANERLAGLAEADAVLGRLVSILEILQEKPPQNSEVDKKVAEIDKALADVKMLSDEQKELRNKTEDIRNALTEDQKRAFEDA
ncbi:MAG: hypothetical protein RIS21_284, partial [Planctomycetota bacterium]